MEIRMISGGTKVNGSAHTGDDGDFIKEFTVHSTVKPKPAQQSAWTIDDIATEDDIQPSQDSRSPELLTIIDGKFICSKPWALASAISGLSCKSAYILWDAIWRIHGITKKRFVKVHNKACADLHIDKRAKRRALAQLEKAGFIKIERIGKLEFSVTILRVK
jgi:hypothetical protein